MNDNAPYIVQCSRENFEDVKGMLQVFGGILDVDGKKYCIRTFSLDALMKKRLDEMDVGFWQELDSALAQARKKRTA